MSPSLSPYLLLKSVTSSRLCSLQILPRSLLRFSFGSSRLSLLLYTAILRLLLPPQCIVLGNPGTTIANTVVATNNPTAPVLFVDKVPFCFTQNGTLSFYQSFLILFFRDFIKYQPFNIFSSIIYAVLNDNSCFSNFERNSFLFIVPSKVLSPLQSNLINIHIFFIGD